MSFLRLLTPAAAVMVLSCPLVGVAQTADPTSAAPAAPTVAAPAAPTAASPNVVAKGDVISTLQASGHFTVLTKALDQTNLSATLKTAPNITLFAPTDEAFAALPPAQLAALLSPKNAPTLQKVLIYHLVNTNIDSTKIKGAKGPVQSVENGKLELDGSGTPLKVNDANIIQTDVRTSNGIIQVVDKVLIPADVSLPTASAEAKPAPSGG
jgi:uncharacterized surface protein with fasciclin (FAS1) repeats